MRKLARRLGSIPVSLVCLALLSGCPEETGDDTQGAGSFHGKDLNGDGFPDLAIGAAGFGPDRSQDLGRDEGGRVLIFFGPLFLTVSESNADVVLRGEAPHHRFGFDVATADVNGDGSSDVIVGAPLAGPEEAGRIYLFYGPVPAGSVSAGSADVIVTGQFAGQHLGWSVAAGHLTGAGRDAEGNEIIDPVTGSILPDRFADILVGAPGPGPGTEVTSRGRAFVIPGSATLVSGTLDETGSNFAALLQNGEAEGDQYGFDVAAGNVNGDGFDDALVGAPRFDLDATNADVGRVYVLFGRASFDGISFAAERGADVLLTGETPDDEFGHSLATGTVVGIATASVIVGAPNYGHSATSLRSKGRAYVFFPGNLFSKRGGEADVILEGVEPDARFGATVATGDLIPGDTVNEEVVVGAPLGTAGPVREAGRVYVFASSPWSDPDFANPGGFPFAPTETGSTADEIFENQEALSGFGASLAVCDILRSSTGPGTDGNADLLIGAPFADVASREEGRVYVFMGPFVDDTAGLVNRTIDGTTVGGRFGSAIAGPSDSETGEAENEAAGDPEPAEPTLTILFQGAGSGRVVIGALGRECTESCSFPVPSGTRVELVPVVDPGSVFQSWAGCDQPGDLDLEIEGCSITVDGDRTITVTFEPR